MSTPRSLELPAGVVKANLQTARGTFAVLDNGPAVGGSPDEVLLVPGFMGSKEDFLAILGPLAQENVHAVAMDLSGQFESPEIADSPLALDSFAADVASVISTMSTKPHLVGHSMGGLVAREAVLSDPLSVRTLTLLNSGPAALPAEQQARLKLFAEVLREHGLEAVWAAKQALEEAEGLAQPSDPAIREFLTKRFLSNSSGSLLAMAEALCSVPDRTDELAATAPPTLVCYGELDDAWPPNEQRVMGDRLAAQVVQLDGLGHSPAVEDPERTVDALASFWREAG